MVYMQGSTTFRQTGIQELSLEEVLAVFGGTDTAPTSVPPGACPPGYVVQSATYDANGNLASLVCVPSSINKQVKEVTSTTESVLSVLSTAGKWVWSFF